MAKLRVSDVANILKISQTTIYKRLPRIKDRLNGLVEKVDGILLFDPAALDVFRGAIKTASKDAIVSTPSNSVLDISPLMKKMESLEKVLLLMAEKMSGIEKENRSLRLRLEPPVPEKPKPPAPIRAIVPEPSQRTISFWESVTIGIDDFKGFVFGKG